MRYCFSIVLSVFNFFYIFPRISFEFDYFVVSFLMVVLSFMRSIFSALSFCDLFFFVLHCFVFFLLFIPFFFCFVAFLSFVVVLPRKFSWFCLFLSVFLFT